MMRIKHNKRLEGWAKRIDLKALCEHSLSSFSWGKLADEAFNVVYHDDETEAVDLTNTFDREGIGEIYRRGFDAAFSLLRKAKGQQIWEVGRWDDNEEYVEVYFAGTVEQVVSKLRKLAEKYPVEEE